MLKQQPAFEAGQHAHMMIVHKIQVNQSLQTPVGEVEMAGRSGAVPFVVAG
jgi:hypothetical protein